jgi:DNA replication protein DnaC
MSLAYEAQATAALETLGLSVARSHLDQVSQQAAAEGWSYSHFLGYLLEGELRERHRKTVALNLQFARFPYEKRLGEFDFDAQPGLDRRLIEELATGRFLYEGRNIIFLGPPGVGKTHLAIALGRAAVETGHTTLFITATALLASLVHAESEGQLADKLLYYSKPRLLVIDELGYLPFERRSAHLFFQLVARRYEKGSILLTTNQTVSQWGTVFGDDVLAAAILDRLLHHSHTLMVQGESYRLRLKKKAGLLGHARGSEAERSRVARA